MLGFVRIVVSGILFVFLPTAYSILAVSQEPAASGQSTPATPLPAAASAPSTSSASQLPPDPLGDAKALLRQGKFDAAIERYQQILQEKPKSPDAYAGLVRAYLKKRDVEKASDTATKALQVTDAWPVHVALGEVYFRQGRITEAEKE